MINDGKECRKWGVCPWCKQERMLTWFIARYKGTGHIVSGFVCRECFDKATKGDKANE